MASRLKIGLVRASLPSYFPDQHKVWSRCEAALGSLCEAHAVDLFVAPDIPMDATDTLKALEVCNQAGVDFILVLHGGFTMGDVARTVAAAPVRAGFWSIPEPIRTGDIQLNNFVTLNMSMSISRQVRSLTENPVQWYHGAPESEALQLKLGNTFKALKALHDLQNARIAVIGGLAMTFYNMEVSTNALRRRLGVEVSHLDIHELTDRMQAIEASRLATEITAMASAARVDGVSDAQMELTARAALAMRDLACDSDFDALAVSDWPALQNNPGMHPGAAFTWLEEVDHLPVASEGDVLGAITQLVAKSLTGRVGYLLDMTEPDLDSGELLMWHGGGGPLYLADDDGARWINHPMIGRGTEEGPIYGAISDLYFKEGPVDVFRVARDAGALFHMQSTVKRRDPNGFTGCRGWLENFSIDGKAMTLEDIVNTVMCHGLEHHFILVSADVSAPLIEMASWSGMEILEGRLAKGYLDVRDYV